MFNHHIHSILWNDFEFMNYYGDRITTLAELSSISTNISNGDSIHIFVKNMNTELTFQPVFSKISKVHSDETRSLSSMSNISPMSTRKISVFVKIISNIISFKTEFHQFATSSEEKYSDLLQNVLDNHMAEGIISKEEDSLLQKFEWKITLYATDKCNPFNTHNVKLTDSCISILTSVRSYILFKVLVDNVDKQETSLRSNVFQIMMNSSRELMIPNEAKPHSFPQKLYITS